MKLIHTPPLIARLVLMIGLVTALLNPPYRPLVESIAHAAPPRQHAPATQLAAGDTPTALATGGAHTCALLQDSTVQCWGANWLGQLGDDTVTQQPVPVVVRGLSGVTALTAGSVHTCGLRQDGTVVCWGANWGGQLGDGTTTERHTWVAVRGLSTARAIGAGRGHSCALLQNGTVQCWGGNWAGQLGDGTTTTRTTPVVVSGLNSVTALSVGYSHACALRQDGTIWCWGDNTNGQLGDGTTTMRTTPVAVSGLSGITALAAGQYHTCALRQGGAVVCWGNNESGQVGDGTIIERHSPATVSGLSSITALSGGYSHTCALRQDGIVWCWGGNWAGQLGDSTVIDRHTPIAVSGLSGITMLMAGYDHTCALRQDGTIWCWGDNADGQAGSRTGIAQSVPLAVSGLNGVSALTAGNYHICALRQDGSAACWGSNGNGQLGDSTTIERHSPVMVSDLSGVTALVAGANHTCALRQDSSVACWGGNWDGQMGDGTTIERHSPVVVSGLSGVTALTAGYYHTCALRQDGTVACWGGNWVGQIGDGTTTHPRTTPVTVSGLSGVTALAAGGYHTCALRQDGTVACWGGNWLGQLGDGTTIHPRTTPVTVSGLSGVRAIAAGGWHTCALRQDGSVVCWGYNGYGELGDGTTTTRMTPVAVSGLSGVTALAAGGYHTCALRQDGVVCWGDNDNSQLGDGTTIISHFTPTTLVGLSSVNTITAGREYTCALRQDSSVVCWGNNRNGQLGNGEHGNQATPIRVLGLPASGLMVRVPAGLRAATGTQIDIPIQLDGDASGRSITAWSATLAYDPAVLRFVTTRTEGTLSAGWSVTANDRTPGLLHLAAYGTTALNGSGVLITLAFTLIGSPGNRTNLPLSAFRFNEDSPIAAIQPGDLTVSTLNIGGSVRYQRNNVAIPNATLTLSNSSGTSRTATSDASGQYVLTSTDLGPATVSITKTGDLRSSLSALDAAWIAQYDAGLRTFTPEQIDACDVSGNGSCTTFDASLLASYLIGAPQPGSQVGSWRFTPPQRSYPLLDQDLPDERYVGVVRGDVTTNWGTSSTQTTGAPHAVPAVVPLALPAGTATEMPVFLHQVADRSILGYVLTISYDPDVLTVQGVEEAGSLSAGWSVLVNNASAGQLTILAYGTQPLQGADRLLTLSVASRSSGATSALLQVARLQLNEEPAVEQPGPEIITLGEPLPLVYLPLLQQ